MSTTTEPVSSSEGPAQSAAYLATRDTSSTGQSSSVLDENGKLSSAGAATSLKLARAQDLPSFPSQGGVSLASAGAAASLAESNQKTFEHWKPGKIPAANKAAMQAKDYEMDPLWHPEMSRAGSKAAILAHRNTKSPDAIYTPLQTTYGQSAAGIAQSNNFSPNAITSREPPVSDHRKALMAATGAMSGSRRRADSAPIRPQTQPKTTNWALQAATSSHRAQTPTEFTTGDPGFEASRIQNMAKNNVNRQMYGSAPPVSIEVQEKNRQDMLRASAVAMARKMYAVQQTQIDEARGNKNNDNVTGARVARNRAASDATNPVSPDSPNRYVGLEEAARKLAQERLAKIHDEHEEYRQYYGAQASPRKSKLAGLSMRNRRGRASSYERDSDDSDEEQSRKIRSQMSIFQSKLAEVDGKKRQADRDALLDAAHKNVTKQMNAMDEKVFKDTGKTSPQQRELWERQARERAQRDSDERMINVGKVHIGGGKYLDQSEIDAIARARLQPTLDDITEKAEKQRARDEEIRLEQERQKAEAEKEKQRQREIQQGVKENQQKEKEEERARKAEEKRVQKEESTAAKEKRQAEAAAAKEKARVEKEEKRRSKDDKQGRFTSLLGRGGVTAAGATGVATVATVATAEPAARPTVGVEAPNTAAEPTTKTTEPASPAVDSVAREEPESPETPSSPEEDRFKDAPSSPTPADPNEVSSSTSPKGDSKVKSWFKSRFRSASKTQDDSKTPFTEAEIDASATRREEETAPIPRSDSMRDVAMAGRKDTETDDMYGDSRDNDVAAPVSPVGDNEPLYHSRSTSISGPSIYDDNTNNDTTKPTPEETRVVATPEPPTRLSTEHSPIENLSDTESRGRKGFRQRLLSKVKSNKDKDKDKKNDKTIEEEPTSGLTVEQQAASMPDGGPMHEADNTGASNVGKLRTAKEDEDEARDNFVEEKLAPPPKLGDVKAGSPRGSRERSKFKEDL